jgi:hypothetical protein
MAADCGGGLILGGRAARAAPDVVVAAAVVVVARKCNSAAISFVLAADRSLYGKVWASFFRLTYRYSGTRTQHNDVVGSCAPVTHQG